MKIICFCLFDITRTNVNIRRRNDESGSAILLKQSDQQSNFETVLQIIGMRSQPENITDPEKTMESLSKSKKWGTKYITNIKIPVWRFEFTVSQASVFDDGISPIGKLIQDCSGIPIVTGLDEWPKIDKQIMITDELRTIYFEVSEETE